MGDATDAAYDRVLAHATERGLDLYPHQEEAVLELLAGNNVILATPTGSGKSLVALAAHMAALAEDRVSFYTAPIKALVSEKFFDLCEVFGAEDVGMLTGDVAVNPDAPIICCTAEVLANIALREGEQADVGLVVMDEFHFYGEPGRGWAWQVPLIELPQAQHLLMSATLGDVTELAADISRRNGRETAVVDDAVRPVPLTFTWSLTPLEETLEELVTTGQGPVYVVHFSQAEAIAHAEAILRGFAAREVGSRPARPTDARSPSGSRTCGSPRGSARRCPSCCGGGSACTTPGCCPATGGWSSSSPRRVCSPSSAGPTPWVSASTCRSGRSCSAGWRSTTAAPAGAEVAGVPPDRGPGGPGRLRHRRLRRRAGAGARDRQRARQGEGGGQERRDERGEAGQARLQGAAEEAAAGHHRVDRADLRQAGRRPRPSRSSRR